MYRTYAQLKDRFGARMRLLYTDTDSFIMQLFGDAQYDNDVYKEIKETPDLRGIFDLSNVTARPPQRTLFTERPQRRYDRFLQERDEDGTNCRRGRNPPQDVLIHGTVSN